jgi:aspartate/methionine/tyrosine aminotransferase
VLHRKEARKSPRIILMSKLSTLVLVSSMGCRWRLSATGWFGSLANPFWTTSQSSSLFVQGKGPDINGHRAVGPRTVARGGATSRRWTVDSMSQSVRKMEYAVRGPVVSAADEISTALRAKTADADHYDFDHIIYTNIGNPQAIGQHPLTWPRQVCALVDLPPAVGIDHPDVDKMFPADAIARAREILEGLHGAGSGAYSHSKGALIFRQDVADFITQRDNDDTVAVPPADPEHIFLTNGASQGIVWVLNCLLDSPEAGVLIPIPQYPIYSATIDLFGGHKVGYYLNEENGWSLDMNELERALSEAQQQGIHVRSMVLINPGNPTGSVLSRENLIDIVHFCARNNLVLLADEVYQENVYDESKQFISCKRAAAEAGLLQNNELQLVSFHSVSKGVFGECGRRGGYAELVGVDDDVIGELYKLASAGLCSALSGQIMMSLMVRGPGPTDVSYESHEAEKRAVFQSLKRKASMLVDGLNAIDGMTCQQAAGAMYCFPSVTMPPGAEMEASKQKMPVDMLYCLDLLKTTGICVVPASGFGQKEGRHGFRTTFLPSESEMIHVVDSIKSHYNKFNAKYATVLP